MDKKTIAGGVSAIIAIAFLFFLFFEVNEPIAKGSIVLLGIVILFLLYKLQQSSRISARLEADILRLRDYNKNNKPVDKESEKIYRTLAANIPGSAITILDREERYLLAEGDMLAGMGYVKANMPGRKISEVITPENYAWYKHLIDGAFAGNSFLKERRTLSGLDALIKVVPLRDEEGDIFAIMFVLLDVTILKKVQTEFAALNAHLEIKIEERTQQLVDLNKQMEGFSYSVSHDLRAPLRAIAGYSKVLEEDYSDKLDDEGRITLGRILRNAHRMNQLIDDLLNFSRLGRAELKQAPIDFNALVDEVTQELTNQERSRKINIRKHQLSDVSGDLNMLRQVWINLISNALKYTRNKESAEIEIRSSEENGSIRYSISDNGAGFDMAYAEKLFGVFQRLHRADEFEGTGVGLALVSTIIKRHHGKIWAESELNVGTTFF